MITRRLTKCTTSLAACTAYYRACEELVQRVNDHLFGGTAVTYWVNDQPGCTCCFSDFDFLTPDEMVLILEYELSYDEYAEWRDANLDYENSSDIVELRSWIYGFRRHTKTVP